MITITRTITITSDIVAPFSYNFTLPDPSCATYVATDNGVDTITVTFSFETPECRTANETVVFNLEDSSGCSLTQNINIADPCATFVFVEQIPIIQEGAGVFRAPVTGGSPAYTWEWTVDPTVLQITGQNGDAVTFNTLANEALTEVTVEVTDQSGCSISYTLDYNPCMIDFPDVNLIADCTGNGDSVDTGRSRAFAFPCIDSQGNGIEINWATLTADIPFSTNFENFGGGFFSVQFPPNIATQTVYGTLSVEDSEGNVGTGNVTIQINSNCDDDQGFGTPIVWYPYDFNFGCTACLLTGNPGNVGGITIPDRGSEQFPDCIGAIEVTAEELINQPNLVDWTTFTFVQLTGQTLVNPQQVLTPNGTAYFTSNQSIVYVPNLIPANNDPDLIQFNVEVGGQVNTHTITFTRDFCGEAPVAVDDSICTVCTESTGPINLLENDLGDIDPSSFQFLGPFPTPTQGVLSVQPNGIIEFAPAPTFDGQVQFSYNVANQEGQRSNNAAVTITVNCLTITDYNESWCKDDADAVDLWGIISGTTTNTTLDWYFQGYSSTEEGTKGTGIFGVNSMPATSYAIGSTISSPNIAILDLSDAQVGFYEFQYGSGQGSCEVAVTVTIEIIEAVDLPDNKACGVCTTLGTININSLVEEELPAGTWNSSIDPSLFNPDTGILDLSIALGSYVFNYVVDNQGTYNVACSSYFTLTVSVQEPGYNPGAVCYYFCTNGPTGTDPNCKLKNIQ